MRIEANSVEVGLTAARERVLLAALLLHTGDSVPVPHLIDAIWGDAPPRNARNQLQGCVSRLRRSLAGIAGERELVGTDPNGYRVRVGPRTLDLLEFRQLRGDARAAAASGRHADAAERYQAAMALWRGAALADIDSELVRRAALALDEERAQALEEQLDVELALGWTGDLIPRLTELVGRYPYRERLHAGLMLALYRAGRQVDALDAYRRARKLFRDELGIELGNDVQQLHRAILNRDPDLDDGRVRDRAGSAAVVPRELPASVVGFTGRVDALKALDDSVAEMPADTVAPVVISAVDGTAGVGKTALAVRWAHRVADRFPDGQLYVNLRGYAAGAPLRPIDALAALLHSLGTPPEQIPTDEAQAAALYRTRAADRRMLIVLDNARSVDQVRPLLPGSTGCLVLVTSRDRLAGLVARDGARRITLDVLTPDEAVALLSGLLGAGRADAEPDEVAGLARACAYLPLALRIAAASLADDPDRTVGAYLAELTAGDRLAMLQTDDDEESAVRATFELSYRSVPSRAQRLFRLLGLVPGPDVTPTVAGTLIETDEGDARRLLERLASAHLLQEHAAGRYAFHDLLRLYARQLSDTTESSDEQTAAMGRLLDGYLQTVRGAAERLYPQMLRLPAGAPSTQPPLAAFQQPADAVAWLDSERANLAAAIAHAADHGPPPLAWQLADCLRGYFLGSRHNVDWHTVATSAARAAESCGDVAAQASAQLSLGDLHLNMGKYADAVTNYMAATDLARQADWPGGQAAGLGNLGIAHRDQGRLPQAAACYEQALVLNQQIGRLGGEANNRVNLGNVQTELGRLESATEQLTKALALYRRVGSLGGEAIALADLGVICHDLGQHDRAAGYLSRAVELCHESGNRILEAGTRCALAAVQSDTGRVSDAIEHAKTSLELVAGADDRRYEAVALNALGRAYLAAGRAAEAAEHYRRALAASRDAGVLIPEIEALIGQASGVSDLGENDAAIQSARLARAHARQAGYQVLEGRALTVLAMIYIRQGDYAEAGEHARDALESHRRTGHRLGTARTLALLGQIEDAVHNPRTAEQHWRAARSLFAEIGVPPGRIGFQPSIGRP